LTQSLTKKYIKQRLWSVILGAAIALTGLGGCAGEGKPVLSSHHPTAKRWITSSYFDKAMDYEGSRFEVISFAEILGTDWQEEADAVVLECRDDYEGLISVRDIRRFDLQLATRIELTTGSKAPDWLVPWLVVVPDGSAAPFQERFITANIRQIRPVRFLQYYAPIRKRLGKASLDLQMGFDVFRDNCLFCHSLEGVGGNKGIPLMATYDFLKEEDAARFTKDFRTFHGSDNPDKQNMAQFVGQRSLRRVTQFLARLEESSLEK